MDLGVAFTSSVETKEENGINVRKRSNKLVVDTLFASIIRKPIDKRGDNVLWTHFFHRCQGIEKDTLSLNRILIGTQVDYETADSHDNIWTYSFKGINASDRDFKRAKIKFNFELKPQFDFLYKLLKIQFEECPEKCPPNSVLVPENSPKQIPYGWFGYQIKPFIGFEVGRIYRTKRDPFSNENSGQNLRRIIFGMEALFNITRRMNISLTDIFYVRGETSEGRTRNYFKTEFTVPFYQSSRTSQSFYLSFEKGDQPPFVTPAVNALKISYRINSNFWSRKP